MRHKSAQLDRKAVAAYKSGNIEVWDIFRGLGRLFFLPHFPLSLLPSFSFGAFGIIRFLALFGGRAWSFFLGHFSGSWLGRRGQTLLLHH